MAVVRRGHAGQARARPNCPNADMGKDSYRCVGRSRGDQRRSGVPGVNKGDHAAGESFSSQGVWRCVETYSARLGLNVAPHDLRRTHAKLAYRGGAKLDQIQLALGHASLTTTERYLGVHQDLTDAPADYLHLDLLRVLRLLFPQNNGPLLGPGSLTTTPARMCCLRDDCILNAVVADCR